MERFAAEQAERQRYYNLSGNERKRDRELKETLAQRRRLP